ncbi:MAG TPA: GlsB/YeaQ/YmgE family stress response membrane protein [Bauldia sp.]|nr:GlsB/YeaQ/YmgE family stress response membrane protein [Bauldia sp.]
MHIIWTIIIGLLAGIVAKLLVPGRNYEPRGFILTAVLGIVGALLATWIGQGIGWYQPGEAAGFIGAVVGAVIILLIWGAVGRSMQGGNRAP